MSISLSPALELWSLGAESWELGAGEAGYSIVKRCEWRFNWLCKSFVGSVSTVAEGKHCCVSILKLMGRL